MSVSCKSRLSRCCFGLPPFCWWQNGRVSCWSICQAEGQKIVRSDKFVSSNNFKTRESSSRGKNIVNSKIDLIWIFRYPKFKVHFKKISIKCLYFFRIFLEYFRIFLEFFRIFLEFSRIFLEFFRFFLEFFRIFLEETRIFLEDSRFFLDFFSISFWIFGKKSTILDFFSIIFQI